MKNNFNFKKIFNFALKNHQNNNFDIAEKSYKQLLKQKPDHLESIFLLGSLYAQIKKLDKAKKMLEEVIRINPKHSDAYNNLANVMVEQKDYQNAVNCFEQAININSNYSDAFFNYGNLLKKIGKFEKAIQCYEKTIKINPNYLNVHNNLAVIFKNLGQYSKAVDLYEKEIEKQPNQIHSIYNLGIVFYELGEYDKAINCYEKVIKIDPLYSDAHHNLSHTLVGLGEFEKAKKSYKNAINFEPENLEHYYLLSLLDKKVFEKDNEKKINQIMKRNKLSDRNKAYGNFLLSKFEFRKKEYKKEFKFLLSGHSCFYKANENFFKNQNNYTFKILPDVNKLIKLEKFKLVYNKIKPIFIIGVPRCGSTLVEKIISSSDQQIKCGEETGIFSSFIKEKLIKNEKVIDHDNVENVLLEKYINKKLINKNYNNIFTDKSLENFFYINLIKEIFPHAKVINCKRNNLSSIVSILKNNLIKASWAHNLKDIFKYFDIYYKTIEIFNKTHPDYIYELNLEQLVDSPKEESMKLMKFCELPWNKKCLEFHNRKDLISKTASNIQIREGLYKDKKEKYFPYKKFINEYGKKYSWYN